MHVCVSACKQFNACIGSIYMCSVTCSLTFANSTMQIQTKENSVMNQKEHEQHARGAFSSVIRTS